MDEVTICSIVMGRSLGFIEFTNVLHAASFTKPSSTWPVALISSRFLDLRSHICGSVLPHWDDVDRNGLACSACSWGRMTCSVARESKVSVSYGLHCCVSFKRFIVSGILVVFLKSREAVAGNVLFLLGSFFTVECHHFIILGYQV